MFAALRSNSLTSKELKPYSAQARARSQCRGDVAIVYADQSFQKFATPSHPMTSREGGWTQVFTGQPLRNRPRSPSKAGSKVFTCRLN